MPGFGIFPRRSILSHDSLTPASRAISADDLSSLFSRATTSKTTVGASISVSTLIVNALYRQNFPDSKHKIFRLSLDKILPMNYRKQLAENLKALMTVQGLSPETLKAPYLDGTKLGKSVSKKTISNVVNNRPGSSALGLDGLGALAAYFGIEVYLLLVPGLDPLTQPIPRAEKWMENEVERRVAARLPGAFAAKLSAMAPMQATAPRPAPVAGRAGEIHVSHAPTAGMSRAALRKKGLELVAMYNAMDPVVRDELFAAFENAAHKNSATKKTKHR